MREFRTSTHAIDQTCSMIKHTCVMTSFPLKEVKPLLLKGMKERYACDWNISFPHSEACQSLRSTIGVIEIAMRISLHIK